MPRCHGAHWTASYFESGRSTCGLTLSGAQVCSEEAWSIAEKKEQRGEIYDAAAAGAFGQSWVPFQNQIPKRPWAMSADGIVIKRDLFLAGGEPQPMFLFGKWPCVRHGQAWYSGNTHGTAAVAHVPHSFWRTKNIWLSEGKVQVHKG